MFFSDLQLSERLMAGIQSLGFTTMTPIQQKALPPGLAGRDVVGQAQTGTGKTLAFLLPAFEKLLGMNPSRNQPLSLVLSPTRELAVQVAKDAVDVGEAAGIRTTVVFGGVGYGPQREALEKGVHLLVATPGRLLDLEQSGAVNLKKLKVLIVDEADRMFDMGFIRDVRRIIRRCPPKQSRQTFMFSATLSYDVVELAYEEMEDMVELRLDLEKKTPELAAQALYHLALNEKMPLLLGLLEREEWKQVLIFVNTRRGAEEVHRRLQGNNIQAAYLTGAVDQAKRLKLMDDFKKQRLPILIATDVASRGLHIEGVSHVINYDLPQDPEEYVHRVGRTARAGQKGKVISLACERYVESLPAIEEFLGEKIPVEHLSDSDLVKDRSPRPPPRTYSKHAPRPGSAGRNRPPSRRGHSKQR